MTKRKVWQIAGNGVLEQKALPIGEVGEGEVLVRIRALSLNYRDLMIIDDGDETIPVSDGSGDVVAVGEGVTDLSCGDRVMPSFFLAWKEGRYDPRYRASALGAATPGLASEYVVLPASALVRIPKTLSYEEAATLPCAGVTAWNALRYGEALTAGDTALIQGTGGVSLFALQLAHARGLRTIVLTSSEEKASVVRALGAEHVINYRTHPSWAEQVHEITDGRGVERVIEVIGTSNLTNSIAALAPHGEIAYIGCLAGFEGEFDPMQLLYKNASLRGIYVGSRHDLIELMASVVSSGLRPVIAAHYDFDRLPEAVEYMRSQKHLGKVVVRVG